LERGLVHAAAEELAKVEVAIAAAKAEWRERGDAALRPDRAVPLSFEMTGRADTDVIAAVLDIGRATTTPSDRVLYHQAAFAVNRAIDPHEAPLAEMAAYIVKIVEVEGPVHIDEIAARTRILWGLQRAGNGIRSAVARAANVAVRRGLLEGGPFARPNNHGP
jgi:hypothetical protein